MSKVAKKFHLDSDGYLTTKPDRQLTTEEEATSAAEAAIDEALEEGGAIAEAIAASGGDSGDIKVKPNIEIQITGPATTTSTNNGKLGNDLTFEMVHDLCFIDKSQRNWNMNYDYNLNFFLVNPYSPSPYGPTTIMPSVGAVADDHIWLKNTEINGTEVHIVIKPDGKCDITAADVNPETT